MKLCTCAKCSQYTFTNDQGVLTQGQLISKHNWSRHQLKIESSIQNCKLKNDMLELPELNQLGPLESSSSRSSSSFKSWNNSNLNSTDSICVFFFLLGVCNGRLTRNWLLLMATTVLVFLAWLHLFCRFSSINCQVAHNFILKLVAQAQRNPPNNLNEKSVPKDLRTISKRLQTRPILIWYVCCPECFFFFLYTPPNVPPNCQYQETPHAQKCLAQLFKTSQHLQKTCGANQQYLHQYKEIHEEYSKPRSAYVTQPDEEWLTWFFE